MWCKMSDCSECCSSAVVVGCVGVSLVSESEVESSRSEGQTSMLWRDCRRETQQCC